MPWERGAWAVMDHGWIVTQADPSRPGMQINVMTHDETAPIVPYVSVHVDTAHGAAVRKGAESVHSLTDRPWGVHRFFVRDPDGNVVSHH